MAQHCPPGGLSETCQGERREEGDEGDVLEGVPFLGELEHTLLRQGRQAKNEGMGCCQAQGTDAELLCSGSAGTQ